MLSRRQLMNDKIVSAQSENLSLTNVKGSKLNALSVYGKSTQDGTPSPENPVPIASAGSVMTTGAQLLDIPDYSGISNGVSWNIKDGKIIADGTAVDNYSYSPFYELNLTPGTYYISPISQEVEFYVRITKDSQNQYYINNTFDIDGTEDEVMAYAAVNPGITVNNVVIYPMLNAGSTALPWEPYTGGVPGVNPYEGEINVNVGGKNLIPFPYMTPDVIRNGLTFTVQNDGGVHVEGTSTDITYFDLCKIDFGKAYTDANITVSGMTENIKIGYNQNNFLTSISVKSGLAVNETIYPQVEYGTVATAYEPYKTPQTITLSTPGGLPGIPVSSGGNYTDENGQQWVCDEIDLARGKYVQRVGKGTLNSDDVPNQKVTTYDECDVLLYQIQDMESHEGYRNLLCNKYGAFNGYWTDGLGKMSSNSGHVYFGVLKGASGVSDGTKFVYPLATPIETDLPAEEIAAYKALHTYTPNTSVGNDVDAGVKIGYREYKN